MKKEDAFTGLEAAIVLIAFVVVAAVFSYVMLGAGFFATQKAQEVTYSGIQQSTSNLVFEGNIYGAMDTGVLSEIYFWVMVPIGGQAQNLSAMNILMTSSDKMAPYTLTYNSGSTVVADKFIVETGSAVSALQPGEDAKISIGTSSGNTGQPAAGSWFTLEVKPKVGAASLVKKTLSTGYNGGVIT